MTTGEKENYPLLLDTYLMIFTLIYSAYIIIFARRVPIRRWKLDKLILAMSVPYLIEFRKIVR